MSSVMQDLLAQSTFETLREGSIVPGTITEIRQNEVVVDIGGKSEGVITASEFPDLGELQVGSEIDIFLEKLENRDGNPVLSFDKAEQKKNWENILTKCEEGSIVSGRVRSKVKGGLYGKRPSLAPDDLIKGDIAHTTDYRSVYATLLENHLGVDSKPILLNTFQPLGFI